MLHSILDNTKSQCCEEYVPAFRHLISQSKFSMGDGQKNGSSFSYADVWAPELITRVTL